MKLTPTQLMQLRALEEESWPILLGTVKSLIRKGLVRERYPGDLKSHCRMPSAYPLTEAGRELLTNLNDSARDQRA